MLTTERHDRIRSRLLQDGKVLAAPLALEFGVSEDTLRRDLRELARAGLCRRVYGGALLPIPAQAPDLGPIAQRSVTMVESKLQLARAVASLISRGQTLFIDAGSTNIAVAQALPPDLPVTVITNAPAVALALGDLPMRRIILLGGRFDADKGACIGLQTLREAQRIEADVLVLGSCGVDARAGVTALDDEEAELKRCLVEQSRAVIVPATADKLNTVAPFAVAPPERIDHLVVPAEVPAAALAGLEALGLPISRAASQ